MLALEYMGCEKVNSVLQSLKWILKLLIYFKPKIRLHFIKAIFNYLKYILISFYGVVVSAIGFNPINPGSNPGRSFFFIF